jgi:hypothetical protein
LCRKASLSGATGPAWIKLGQVTQMINDRCGVEETLALLKSKGSGKQP